MAAKKYRVNESEVFNLQSMYDKLNVWLIEMQDGEREWDETIFERLEEVEDLMNKAYGVGALVDWNTLKRIREIKEERQMLRYARSLTAGHSERDAAFAFQL